MGWSDALVSVLLQVTGDLSADENKWVPGDRELENSTIEEKSGHVHGRGSAVALGFGLRSASVGAKRGAVDDVHGNLCGDR